MCSRMLGHASAAITLDVSAGPFEDDLDAVAIVLERSRSIAPAEMKEGGRCTAVGSALEPACSTYRVGLLEGADLARGEFDVDRRCGVREMVRFRGADDRSCHDGVFPVPMPS